MSETVPVYYSQLAQDPELIINNFKDHLNIKNHIQHFFKVILIVPYQVFEIWTNISRNLYAVCEFCYKQQEYQYTQLFILNEDDFQIKNFQTSQNKIFLSEHSEEKLTITEIIDNYFLDKLNKILFSDNIFKISIEKNEIIRLQPTYIPKPWGQEIWYTGVEKRGVSYFCTQENNNICIPIPWLLPLVSSRILGREFKNKNLVLVKILDPLPQNVFGDLYYEMHTQKNEVYIVTDISSDEGKIKLGFDSTKLSHYKNEEDFKQNFYQKITEYEKVRRKIDKLFDTFRTDENIPLNEPIPVSKQKEWLSRLPDELSGLEQRLRSEMDSFAGYLNLKVGDVVSVPTYVPHALQHGVRVIEFQTPTYERMILSFAQKVLTQNHWDTKAAFECLQTVLPKITQLALIQKNESFTEELVCDFAEFKATRITLTNKIEYIFPILNHYQIIFVIQGCFRLHDNKSNSYYQISEGECFLLPACSQFVSKPQNETVILSCYPKS